MFSLHASNKLEDRCEEAGTPVTPQDALLPCDLATHSPQDPEG